MVCFGCRFEVDDSFQDVLATHCRINVTETAGCKLSPVTEFTNVKFLISDDSESIGTMIYTYIYNMRHDVHNNLFIHTYIHNMKLDVYNNLFIHSYITLGSMYITICTYIHNIRLNSIFAIMYLHRDVHYDSTIIYC